MTRHLATVFKSTGSQYLLIDDTGRNWLGRLRGKLKLDTAISSSNPIAVGDRVSFVIEDDNQGTVVIQEVHDRDNYIVRVSPQNRHQKHIVAANMDQCLLVCTLINPRTSLGFIDRFLITAAAYHIPVVLVMNKKDTYDAPALNKWQKIKSIYEKIGYQTCMISAYTNDGFDEIKEILKSKTTLLAGHSGVGKTTIINTLLPDLQLKVRDISDWSGRGKHTTTFAEMFELPFGGYLIDTPGVKEFGLIDMGKTELSHYFLEMQPCIQNCKFNNCLHTDEPECAVIGALKAEEISIERYESYCNILSELKN